MQEDQRDVREKCERFRQSIMQRANAQIAEIDRKLKEYRVSELGKYEDDARGDSAHLLEEESRRIETAAAHAVSERRAELRRQLYERRIQLTDEVFQKAEESLSEFVSGQEYSEFLRQKAEKPESCGRMGNPFCCRSGLPICTKVGNCCSPAECRPESKKTRPSGWAACGLCWN